MSDNKHYEVIVAGLGGVGSGCLYWLSKSTKSPVLGIEQFSLGHDNGASQDYSRIIRLAYEDLKYTKIASHTYSAWAALEHESGVKLVHRNGILVFGDKKKVSEYAAGMKSAGIPFEEYSSDEAMKRWPQIRLDSDDRAVFQADGGIVEPWKANALHVNLARAHGATVMENTKILKIEPIKSQQKQQVRVITSKGTFTANKLVLCCGAWTNHMLKNLSVKLPIKVTKEQVNFFATKHIRKFTPKEFPVYIHYAKDGTNCYGVPVFGVMGTKAGVHQGGKEVDPDQRTFEPDAEARDVVIKHLQKNIPDFLGPLMYTKTCLYSNTPDHDFLLDTIPEFPEVSVFVGAGHAYKWASFIGLALSQLALTGKTAYDLEAFKLRPGVQLEPIKQQKNNAKL